MSDGVSRQVDSAVVSGYKVFRDGEGGKDYLRYLAELESDLIYRARKAETRDEAYSLLQQSEGVAKARQRILNIT